MQDLGEQIAEAARHRPAGRGRGRPAQGARRRRLRHHRVLGRRLRLDAARHRDPAALRHPPAHRRQRRSRRHPPRAAQRPGAARHRARRRGGRARRLARQRHQPAHRAVPVGDPRDEREDGRAVQRVGRLLVDPQPVVRQRDERGRSDPRWRQPLPARDVVEGQGRRRRVRPAARAVERSRTCGDRTDLDGSARRRRAGSRSRPPTTGRSST